jgi:hypothetical protein
MRATNQSGKAMMRERDVHRRVQRQRRMVTIEADGYW